MTLYLTVDDVRGFNSHFVGADALRDPGLLESAVLRPQSSAFGEDAYPTIHDKAAALLHGLARNHAFVDGNKRTAWAAAATFYVINGYRIHTDDDAIVDLVLAVARGRLDVPQAANVLESWAQPR